MQYLRFVNTTTRIGRVGIPQSIDLESIVDQHAALPVRVDGIARLHGLQGCF